MHESSIAAAVLSAIQEVYSREGGRVRKVKVIAGELQAIDTGVLKEYLDVALDDAGIPLHYEVVTENAEFKCRRCGRGWGLGDIEAGVDVRELIHFMPEAAYAFLKCPSCGSGDFEIVKGRGIRLSFELGE
ncbi:MAG: hydrogenase/urease maturation nickel metallochaperone HypA [Thermofilum sp.]